MKMEKMNEDKMKERIQFFLENKVKVHIELFDRTFFNGIFIKPAGEGVWILNEVKLGETFIFLDDIEILEQFRELEQGGGE